MNISKELQSIASDPKNSAWIDASAGSGKTNTLVNRLIRLLLEGNDPRKIVCITYTNAGAIEMKNRINNELTKFVVSADEEIKKKIQDIKNSNEVTQIEIENAKILFAKILDYSEEFRILTIHAFCQEILTSFPFEANICINYKLVNDKKEELIKKTIDIFLLDTVTNNDLKNSITNFSKDYDFKSTFQKMLKSIIDNYEVSDIYKLYTQSYDDRYIFERLSNILNYHIDSNLDKIEKSFFAERNESLFFLKKQINIFEENNKKEIVKKIIDFLYKTESIDNYSYDEYKIFFLTDKDAIPEKGKQGFGDIFKKYENIKTFFNNEAEKIYKYECDMFFCRCYKYSKLIVNIVKEIIKIYTELKNKENSLDFNDLIDKTRDLLQSQWGMSWVNFKMDNKIEHILVDEAQDTNDIQWEIIKALTNDFFDGQSSYNEKTDKVRTVFVVGDEKQSIFKFQGANFLSFQENKDFYKKKIENSLNIFKEVSFDTSFRSSQNVINFVNKVFSNDFLKEKITTKNEFKHIAKRNIEGRVEIWNLIEKNDDNKKNNIWHEWENRNAEKDFAYKQLAKKISNKIKFWFDNKKQIYFFDKTTNQEKIRTIKYSDIMILFRRRTSELFNYLIKELNKNNIPNSNEDRFFLKDNIISQDIISLLTFLVFEKDDLNLANLFKSPFLNLSEEDLKICCLMKNEYENISLFNILKIVFEEKYNFLFDLKEKSKNLSIYEFFIYLFETRKIRNRFKERKNFDQSIIDDIFDKFLYLADEYEKNNSHADLVGFISYINDSELELKHEINDNDDVIKITTIHSSKGKEAPIVFLTDTINTNDNRDDRIFFYDFDKFPLFKFKDKEQNKNSQYKKIMEKSKIQVENEYYRLLYVAITRAKNELYICDYKKKENGEKDCWYKFLYESIQDMDFVQPIQDELGGFYIGENDKYENNVNIINSNTEFDVDKTNLVSNEFKTNINKDNISNNIAIKIINPSLYYDDCKNIINDVPQKYLPYQKGNDIHKLLEILPNYDSNKTHFIDMYLKSKDYSEKTKIKENILNILNQKIKNLDFDIFSDNSYAEVPITSYDDKTKTIISGVIDRLVVDEEKQIIYIIDYKSNKNKEYIEKYKNQLEKYKTALSKLVEYKEFKIRTFILWTKTVELEEI